MKKFARLRRLSDDRRRRAVGKLIMRAIRDERGGEVLEYAMVAGLIVVGAISVIGCVGTKVLGKWNSISSSL